jgi:uncharacterized protein (UPF0332 family)
VDDKIKDYVIYKLQKAAVSIKEAKLLYENGMNETAVSRLYYAAYYAANALLTSDGLNAKTHTGTKSLLNKEYFLQGKLDNSFADLYTMLMAKRHEADYESFAFIDKQQIPDWIEKTQEFVNKINLLIQKPG